MDILTANGWINKSGAVAKKAPMKRPFLCKVVKSRNLQETGGCQHTLKDFKAGIVFIFSYLSLPSIFTTDISTIASSSKGRTVWQTAYLLFRRHVQQAHLRQWVSSSVCLFGCKYCVTETYSLYFFLVLSAFRPVLLLGWLSELSSSKWLPVWWTGL